MLKPRPFFVVTGIVIGILLILTTANASEVTSNGIAFIESSVLKSTVNTAGDFPNRLDFGQGQGVSIGRLGSGINIISGQLSGKCGQVLCNGKDAGDHQDSFLMQVPEGMQITNLSVLGLSSGLDLSGGAKFSFKNASESTLISQSLVLKNLSNDKNYSIILDIFRDILSGSKCTDCLALSGLTFKNGIYGISLSAQKAAAANNDFKLSYVVVANVSPVPVPAAAWLFGSALMMAGVALRRKRHNSIFARMTI